MLKFFPSFKLLNNNLENTGTILTSYMHPSIRYFNEIQDEDKGVVFRRVDLSSSNVIREFNFKIKENRKKKHDNCKYFKTTT